MNDNLIKYANRSTEAIRVFADRYFGLIEKVAEVIADCISKGGKIIVFGNGGSAADAQHLAGELAGWYLDKKRPAIPVIDLTSCAPTITAIANDSSFDNVFTRQVEGLANPGDIVIGFSTSGNSPNVVAAMKSAIDKRSLCIGFSGNSGGHLAQFCDALFAVDSDETPIIQQVHEFAYHYLCHAIEKSLKNV